MTAQRPVAGERGPRGESVTAFAPASVGNVAVGFDILGFVVDALGDRITVRRADAPGVHITSISGVVPDLPRAPERNTAGRALQALIEVANPAFGFDVHIDKGIPLGSGLGGSAASAVGAVVAANALLDAPLDRVTLLQCAMQGEAVASGSRHADNIAPCLFGGLVLTVGIDHPRVKRIPVPAGILAVAVHPHMMLATRDARAILKRDVDLSSFVWQTANLAGLISGCYTNDLDLIREGLNDVVIEPQRRALIPGFAEVHDAAMASGALGCSIAGAGPTLFAWALPGRAEQVCKAMVAAFGRAGVESDHWIVPLEADGARLVTA